MKIRGLPFLPFAFSMFCLVCYGQASSISYAGSNGNWRLSTAGGGFEHPDQYFTLGVYGNTIIAQGTLSLSCTRDGRPDPIDAFVYLRGQISPDGSFTIENLESPTDTAARGTTISGELPTAGRWSGSITVAAFQFRPPIPGQSPRDCRAASADFSATPLPPVDGRYFGTIRTGKSETDGYVTLTISQGQLSPVGCLGRSNREIQARGRIVVTGSSLFPTGTYETEDDKCSSSIFGSNFKMDLGPTTGAWIGVAAKIDPSDGSRIQVTLTHLNRDEAGTTAVQLGTAQLTRVDDKASR